MKVVFLVKFWFHGFFKHTVPHFKTVWGGEGGDTPTYTVVNEIYPSFIIVAIKKMGKFH